MVLQRQEEYIRRLSDDFKMIIIQQAACSLGNAQIHVP